MKHPMIFLLAILLTALLAVGANAQDFGPGNGDGTGMCRFIDEDGDGVNEPEANIKEPIEVRFWKICRGPQRAWHVWREMSRTWETRKFLMTG